MITHSCGTIEYQLSGKTHRVDGPAIIRPNGSKIWYCRGKLHRLDGPCMTNSGNEFWYKHGKLHRDEGPAIIWAEGDLEWWQDGKLHRLDGPAYEGADGHNEFHIRGHSAFNEAEFNDETWRKSILLKSIT